MNLSKKAFLVIIPVISIFFIAATTIVYQSQKQKIVQLEKNRLKLALSELSTLYNQYSSFSEAYLGTILESNSLKYYLVESSDRYRRVALIRNIESYLQEFTKHRSKSIRLSISRGHPNKEIIEYIELSEDPFSEMPNALKENALSFIDNDRIIQPSLIQYDDKLLLAFSALIDPTTLEKPIETRKKQSIGITFAIEPTALIEEIKHYKENLSFDVTIEDTKPADKNEHSASIKLDSHKYLVATSPPEILKNNLRPTLIKLILIAAIFILSCCIIVLFLVSKYLIQPISTLEQNIKEARKNKSRPLGLENNSDDEIGRLANEFRSLYEQLSNAYRQTNRLAKTDQLTQLDNLYQLKRIFQSRLSFASKNNQTLSFLYIDLDNFKFVNDRYGHDIGDQVLVAFSNAILNMLKTTIPQPPLEEKVWHFGRIAGDEFGIILSNSPSSVQVDQLTSDILALFSGGFNFLTGKYPISTSIGVVHYPHDGETPSQLISNADKAMYQSKRMGKNRTSYYSEQIAYKIRREREVENELKHANFDSEFFLVFLPMVRTENLEIHGFESLLRWNSPRLGFVSPAEFIPIAETCGYFELIDSWVIKQSFESYHQIKSLLNSDYILSINLSSAQIALNKVHKEILELSKVYDIPRRQIQFEVTETTGTEFTNGHESLLNTITDVGFKLAIDDFGTGHTALQQLIDYPASTIKFDKSFLKSTMAGGGRKILKPLVELCHSQLMAVTVEGIETREQYEYMRKIGVDHLQGFLFCQPATLSELQGALVTFQKKRGSLL